MAVSVGNATAPVGVAPRPRLRPRPAWALSVAGLCVVGLAATWALAALVPAAHVRDAIALNDFTHLGVGRPRVDELANELLELLDPVRYTAFAAVLVVVALVRRRPLMALALAVVLAAAPLSAELLKPLLAHQHARVGWEDVGAASWPSGHSTAATTLALCAVLVAPALLRPAVALLGAAFVLAVGVSLLILAWHLPSDVVGGCLLAALWVSLAVAALGVAERRALSRRLRGGARAVRAGVP